MRVDAHQHFWQWSKGWFSHPEAVLQLDYLPETLQPILKAQEIDKTILVQTAPTVAETDFLLELAETSSIIGGVVGWLDLESPDFPKDLEEVSTESQVRCGSPHAAELARRRLDSAAASNGVALAHR